MTLEGKLEILVWVPSRDGWYHESVMDVIVALLRDRRYSIDIDSPTMRPIENSIAEAFYRVNEGTWDYLLIIDNDNPPMKNPLDLVELNKDIITLATPIFNATSVPKGKFPLYWNGFMFKEDESGYKPVQPPVNVAEPMEVDAVGSGCILIARRVIVHPQMKHSFERLCDEWGRTQRGPDLVFCEKARALGFNCWIHFGYICNHIKQLGLLEVFEAIRMERDAALEYNSKGGL